MAITQSKRIKSLSTRYLGFYKMSVLFVLLIVMAFLVWGSYISYQKSGRWFMNIYTTIYISFIAWGWVRINRNVHQVEFDDDFLYVILKGQDIIIPLENIKDVDIKTLGGVYEVELFQGEQLGKKFYFKPSLFYPFNFKKKDELVNVLRRNINRAYQKKQVWQTNALHS
ncbi:MAG: hypothetical protein J0L67_18820 [Cytophagales bacterium]|nr:hypothetical protein [Cytophagales bacterium]